MALRELRFLNDDILRKTCREVTKFDNRLWQLLDDMQETMHAKNGVGLAAPQVGVLRRVAIVDIGEELFELVNPTIIKAEGEQTNNEGCLSVPGKKGMVTRPEHVTVSAFDRNGQPIVVEGTGFLAVAFCHEIDHLNGVLYVDLAEEVKDIDSEDDDDEYEEDEE